MEVLAGDVGGTHTRLAVCRTGNGRPEIVEQREYASADFDGFAAAVLRFREETDATRGRGCLAVPCPIDDGRCDVPNLPWTLDVAALREELEMPGLRLINDFDAVGWGIGHLRDAELEVLKEGDPDPRGAVGYLGAGTGFGHGFLTRRDGRVTVHESEGGHMDFAPRDELECRLLLHLTERYGRTSWERVVSGPGLVATYDFLVADGYAPADPELARRREDEDAAPLISEYARRGDRAAARALDILIRSLGAQAGNLALMIRATGGIYIAGGIAPRILEELKDGRFREAFGAKGRMEELLADVPVWVIMDDDIGLIGAAEAATHEQATHEQATQGG